MAPSGNNIGKEVAKTWKDAIRHMKYDNLLVINSSGFSPAERLFSSSWSFARYFAVNLFY